MIQASGFIAFTVLTEPKESIIHVSCPIVQWQNSDGSTDTGSIPVRMIMGSWSSGL